MNKPQDDMMETQNVLLLVEDSVTGDKVEKAFLQANFQVFRTARFERTLSLMRNNAPKALVIGKSLDKAQQKELNVVLKNEFRKTAFIMLSSHLNHQDKIHAIEDGADDLILSDDLDELVAKVRALIRRISIVSETPKCLTIRDIQINLDTHEVFKNNKPVELTYTQFKLLYLLASQRDNIFSRNEILQKVWGEHAYVTNRTVDVHVKRLREKLGDQDQPSSCIQTIHGMGYRFA